jgi:hypothetical protein
VAIKPEAPRTLLDGLGGHRCASAGRPESQTATSPMATPASSRLSRSYRNTPRAPVRTGFSREGVRRHTAESSALRLAYSRLKPVLLSAFDLLTQKSGHHRTRLGCRLNAGLAQWAEPHGCGESAVRTWMSVRRGPTERDRSEGIPTKEEPNQEHKPLVTWGFIK